MIFSTQFIFNKKITTEIWPEGKLLTAIRERYQLTGEEDAGQVGSHNFEYLNKEVESKVDKQLPKVESRASSVPLP